MLNEDFENLLSIENENDDDERSEMAKEIDDIINGTDKKKQNDNNFELNNKDENKNIEDDEDSIDKNLEKLNQYDDELHYIDNEEIDINNKNEINNEYEYENKESNNDENDLEMSEGYYNKLKPEIENILSLELTDNEEIKQQNIELNSYIEQLNMINSLLSQININQKNDKNNSENKEENEKKEDLLDDIQYYEKQIEHLKILQKVNEGLIESQNEPPKIKEILIQKIEITYENLKYESEIITKKINKAKNKIKENEILIEELKKKLKELENEAKNDYNIDDKFNKDIYLVLNKDLGDEKLNNKKRLKFILQALDIEKKKYEDYISKLEKNANFKLKEKNRLLKILSEEDEKYQLLLKEYESKLIPFQNLQRKLKEKEEKERKRKLEEYMINQARAKLNEEERLENERRNRFFCN